MSEQDARLVAAAADGDGSAWNALVDRHAGLVWSICRRFRLCDADAHDVSQTVWLRLVERLGTLRDPNALAGWLATSTRNECIALWRARQRQVPVDPDASLSLWEEVDPVPPDHDLLAAERHHALRASLRELPDHCQTLLQMLFSDPPATYEQISEKLAVSKGYIGPTRSRCLDKLRTARPLVAYLDLEDDFSARASERGTCAALAD